LHYVYTVDELDYVALRSVEYDILDSSLNSSGSVYRTNFFEAAADVTGFFGLTGGQAAGTLGFLYSADSLEALQTIGAGLWRDVNLPVYRALYNGDDNYRLLNGQTIGAINSGNTILEVDIALVRNEQTYVQRQLNSLPASQRNGLIRDSNAILNNPRLAPPAVTEAIRTLGRPIDFGNYNDRVLIGTNAVTSIGRGRGQ
jgi:hypothetical protein